MTTLLQINTSLFSEQGNSSQLAERFVQRWRGAHPDGRVITRDLAKNPLPHLSAERAQAFFTAPEQRTPEQAAHAAASQEVIDELRSAEVVVLGLPLYNFGIPSTLKAYFDHLARAGITFRYGPNGPVGLLGERKLYVLAARGGFFKGTALDTQTQYITHFFNFLGVTDIEFVYAEGLNISEEQKQQSLHTAQQQIAALAA